MRRLQGFLAVVLPLSVIFTLYLIVGGSPALAVTVNFNACAEGQASSYTESGLTIAAGGIGLHVHCQNMGGDSTMDVFNHSPSGWHVYSMTFAGGTFDLVGFDIVAGNDPATFSNNLGGSVVVSPTVGPFTFGAGWTGVSSVSWTQNSSSMADTQFLAIDNLVFQPTQVNGQVPEPSAALLMTLGLLGIVGKRRMKPVAA